MGNSVVTYKYKIIESTSMFKASVFFLFFGLFFLFMILMSCITYFMGNPYVEAESILIMTGIVFMWICMGILLSPIEHYVIKFYHNHLLVASDDFWGLRKKSNRIKYSDIAYMEYNSDFQQYLHIMTQNGEFVSVISLTKLKKDYKIKIFNQIRQRGIRIVKRD